ncbi:hypothetical protein ACWEFL_02765 [Streptomyces sp. NPDC004838]
MRIRLTDGTRRIDIHADGTPLAHVEATAHRLLAALTPSDTAPEHPPFGFTPDDTPLDGTALSSDTERAEPYTEPGPDPDDTEWELKA